MELINNAEVLQAIAKHKERKEVVVFTNGCFDILHIGHLSLLTEAKKLGDVLVVGLNSDSSIKRIKGSSRPIVPGNERAAMLSALRCVDYVCQFDEDTPLELIKRICPDVLVKGGDWAVEKIIGSDFVASKGGRTLSLPYLPGHSTTEIIERIESFCR